VWIRNRLLSGLSEAQLSQLRLREIGFVFQGFNLSPVLSAWENVEFPLLFRREFSSRARRSMVAGAIDSVGLTDKANRRPNQLSGGEKQRVALARALAGQPSLLLADEPTANLDRDSGMVVVHLMKQLTRERGATCIFATHDPRLMGLADRVIEMQDGGIPTRTSPRHLLPLEQRP
jgi:putative ABC transport system ATP-binding protein